MCAMMNTAQWRLRHDVVSNERLLTYIQECAAHDRESYYALPKGSEEMGWRQDGRHLTWQSPMQNLHPANNRAGADLYDTDVPRTQSLKETPTIILLHALMSANDFGYRRIAGHFNKKGWNVLFPHLPYHYSRRPRGYSNGALTITSDLVRNAETLRQSVIELRQLMAWARQRGSRRIALLATSYGAWVAALTLSLEVADFAILLQPVADVTYATFESPASTVMAGLLKRNGVDPGVLSRHAHLTSPFNLTPKTPSHRITVIGGKYDRLSPPESLQLLCKTWKGARYSEVKQGHFGYGAMRCAVIESERYLD
jgi:pimeloyl-ACP methyl ester carboxylesterase